MMRAAERPKPIAAIVMGMAILCALLLALPAETVTTKYLNDLFIFLDGVHRVADGQVPNRDFHTALGPLSYYVPLLGYRLTGTLGGAMPVGMALVVLLLGVIAAHVLSTRMRAALALPLAAFLILVAAVPINLGESIGALSFAMFYNRIGWAALGILLVMHLRPSQPAPAQEWRDAASAALLVLLMLYMKMSYGAVTLGFLVLMLLDPRQRGWAAGALGLVAVSALAIELVWGGTAAHLADLMLAARVSGDVGSPDELVGTVLGNAADYTIFGVFAVILLWRGRSFRDLLFLGFCAGAGFVLIRQNFQNWGIISLGAGAAVAAEMILRGDDAEPKPGRPLTAGAPFLLLALLLPTAVHAAAALGLHAALASTRQGDPAPLAGFEGVRLVSLWSGGEYPAFSRYFASLADGERALQSLEHNDGGVLVLDFVNPFSAGLGLPSPKGDSTWHHWGRTVDAENHLPAERLFRDVQVVMEPKWPIEAWTANGLKEIYAEYLEDHFALAHESEDWRIYTVKPSPAETVRHDADDVESSASGG